MLALGDDVITHRLKLNEKFTKLFSCYYSFPSAHLKDSRTIFKDCCTVFPTLPVCGFCLEASKRSSLIVSKDAPPISIRDTSSHISSGSERDKAYSRAKLLPISYKTAKTGQMLPKFILHNGKESVKCWIRLFTVPYFSVRFNGPQSWSLNASETGESTKCPWVVAVVFIA